MSSTAPSLDPALRHSPLVRAARREDVPHTPVWFMRQAGRSLPEYRKVREGIAMLDSCRDPDLVTEITLQPVRRHGVDAAIFFSDIVVPLAAVGVDLDIVPGVGPVVAEPVRTRADLDRLPELTPEHVPDITRAVQQLTRELGDTPLIGFAGAPFTLASYLIEGGPSKNHEHTKALMYGDPQLWHDLCARLAQISGAFLRVQASAGASAVQLFDSWVGALPRADYEAFVRPHSAAALAAVADLDVPRIHFGVGTGELLASMGAAGAEVVGVDYRVSLDRRHRAPRARLRRAGQPRPRPAVRAVGRAGGQGARHPGRGPRGAGAHLQPRSRRPAAHRPRRADARRRAGPRGVQPHLLTGRVPVTRRSP